MTNRWIGIGLAVAAGLLFGANGARAQPLYEVPGQDSLQVPLPLSSSRPENGGWFTGIEFMLMHQTRAVGDQIVAWRGLVDSNGSITGLPGTYVGSGKVALETNQLGRTTWVPGYNLVLGYRFSDGVAITFNYMQLFDAHYSAHATLVPPFFRSRPDLSDTFLVAGVFNFPPNYAGPLVKTTFDQIVPGSTYGIWNAASTMDIAFTQRFVNSDITARIPMYDTEYSRVYGLAGGRFAWFWERFWWHTVSYDINGQAGPQDQADFTNILSQRMYGPFIGCGHEVNWGAWALSLDLTAAVLLNVVKERVTYELGDRSTEDKRGRMDYTIVPNLNANLNLWWYPIRGVQMRIGYNAMTFFNTWSMRDPVAYNFGALDPGYDKQWFRLLHGINVGIGVSF